MQTPKVCQRFQRDAHSTYQSKHSLLASFARFFTRCISVLPRLLAPTPGSLWEQRQERQQIVASYDSREVYDSLAVSHAPSTRDEGNINPYLDINLKTVARKLGGTACRVRIARARRFTRLRLSRLKLYATYVRRE